MTALAEATERAFEEFRAGATLESIQAATAFTWGGRALAAYEYFEHTGDIGWLLDAADYAHESLEHAALVSDPAVLDAVREPLFAAAARARLHPALAYIAGTYAA